MKIEYYDRNKLAGNPYSLQLYQPILERKIWAKLLTKLKCFAKWRSYLTEQFKLMQPGTTKQGYIN